MTHIHVIITQRRFITVESEVLSDQTYSLSNVIIVFVERVVFLFNDWTISPPSFNVAFFGDDKDCIKEARKHSPMANRVHSVTIALITNSSLDMIISRYL